MDTCYRAAVRVLLFFAQAKMRAFASKVKLVKQAERLATCTVACAVAVAGSF